MSNNTKTSPSDALVKIAESLENLANSIEEQEKTAEQQQTVSARSLDAYGSLGVQRAPAGSDPLTAFLLS